MKIEGVVLTYRSLSGIIKILRERDEVVAVCKPDITEGEALCKEFKIIRVDKLRQSNSWLVELVLASEQILKAGWIGFCFSLIKASPAHPKIYLAMEKGREFESAIGVVFCKDNIYPLNYIKFVGPKMQRLQLSQEVEQTICYTPTVGALGRNTYQRLVGCCYCVVGLGRSGSLIAHSLARVGVKRLILIDPDTIEPHNIDGMQGVWKDDIGRYKAEALKEHLEREVDILAVNQPILHALEYAVASDVIISCVDNDAARVIINKVSVDYLKPLLDIGTGIFDTGMGADIRLIIPQDGCLLCMGGIRELESAAAELREETISKSVWYRERRGSLLSLNGIAVHLGLRLLEELVRGVIEESIWLRLEYHTGIPNLRRIVQTEKRHNYPLCKGGRYGRGVL